MPRGVVETSLCFVSFHLDIWVDLENVRMRSVLFLLAVAVCVGDGKEGGSYKSIEDHGTASSHDLYKIHDQAVLQKPIQVRTQLVFQTQQSRIGPPLLQT